MDAKMINKSESYLEDLKKERARIDKIIEVVEDYLYGESRANVNESSITPVPIVAPVASEGRAVTSNQPPNDYSNMTIHDAAEKFLESMNTTQTTRQIWEALTNNGLPTIQYNATYTALWRRVAPNGVFIKLGESEWGLARWNMGTAPNLSNSKPTAPSVSPRSTRARSKPSQLDLCENILRDAHKPLHINMLIAKLAEMNRPTSVHSLSSTLRQDGKKRFENLGSNVWALAEWPDTIKNQKGKEAQLPL